MVTDRDRHGPPLAGAGRLAAWAPSGAAPEAVRLLRRLGCDLGRAMW